MTFFDNLALVFIVPTTLLSDVGSEVDELDEEELEELHAVVNIWNAQLREYSVISSPLFPTMYILVPSLLKATYCEWLS